MTSSESPNHLGEVAALFLKLGLFAFGGPAAHIAMMREEVVRRRRWLEDQEFLDMVGATNLIPGPNSTELAIHLGHRRAGWKGLFTAGGLFIVPAVLIVLGIAVLYVEYGTTPAFEWALYGIKPVVIAIILKALLGLGKTAMKGPMTAAVGGAVLAGYLLGVNELLLLAAAGVVATGARFGGRLAGRGAAALALPASLPFLGALPAGAATFSMLTLFLNFLKVGSVLYGSGYVLLAYLRGDLVERLEWLTESQLLDAISVGQLTPGPVFTTATFVGYVVDGWEAALVATVAIFIPSFVFVAALSRILPWARRTPSARARARRGERRLAGPHGGSDLAARPSLLGRPLHHHRRRRRGATRLPHPPEPNVAHHRRRGRRCGCPRCWTLRAPGR